ncbi:MAG TPA: hypothetical protein PKN36_08875 [bacterium]|nr:hypothetical protein [bacterium]
MNINWQKAGIKELAAIISSHLRKKGIEAILVGGACVSLYSDNSYVSYDIDMITSSSMKKIIPVLKELGFQNTGGRLFENPQCRFLIDFPAPPVSIGDEPILKFNSLKTQYGFNPLINPDRLCERPAGCLFFLERPAIFATGGYGSAEKQNQFV